ncbi:MAG TPA: hypothetical protein VGH80_11045 [Xanthomonadaceae bacterium]
MSKPAVSHLHNATEHLGLARDHLLVGAADAMASAADAAREVKAEAGEDIDTLLRQGGSVAEDAGRAIARRPWATVGGAFAAGYLLARLSRRG